MIPIEKDEGKLLFRKGTSFPLQETVHDTGIYADLVYCSHDESKYLLILNNPNPKRITIERGNLGYTFVDCTQETIQLQGSIGHVAFFEYVKASDSELINDLHACST